MSQIRTIFSQARLYLTWLLALLAILATWLLVFRPYAPTATEVATKSPREDPQSKGKRGFSGRTRSHLFGFALLVGICAGWIIVFRPYTLGGPVGYITVAGVSMEPTYHGGDLVLTRRHDSYRVGDIIAYRVEGGIVIHRIVGGNAAEGYDTKGDNADRVDGWRPHASEIIGEAWIHVPGAGTWLQILQQRAVLSAVAGGLATFLVLSGSDYGLSRPRWWLVLLQRRTGAAPRDNPADVDFGR